MLSCSPHPLAGGEGAYRPFPKPHPGLALQASSFGPPGLASPRNVDFVATPLTSITIALRCTNTVRPKNYGNGWVTEGLQRRK